MTVKARGCRVATNAFPLREGRIWLPGIEAECEATVRSKISRLRAVGDGCIRVLDNEGVHLGQKSRFSRIGLVIGVPDVADVGFECHVGCEGPSSSSNGTASKYIDGSWSA